MSKKRGLGFLLGLGLMVLLLAQNAFAGPRGFVLHNVTGVDIYAVYIGSSDDEEWGEDLLDTDELLEDGGDIEIEFSPGSDQDSWDIRVEDSEGNALNFMQVDLLNASTVILKPDNTAVIK